MLTQGVSGLSDHFLPNSEIGVRNSENRARNAEILPFSLLNQSLAILYFLNKNVRKRPWLNRKLQ